MGRSCHDPHALYPTFMSFGDGLSATANVALKAALEDSIKEIVDKFKKQCEVGRDEKEGEIRARQQEKSHEPGRPFKDLW